MAIYKVIATSIRIRTEPSYDADYNGFLYKDGKLTITDTVTLNDGSLWGHHVKGYSCIKNKEGTYMTEATQADLDRWAANEKKLATEADLSKYTAEAQSKVEEIEKEYGVTLSTGNKTYSSYEDDLLNSLRVNNTAGIHGVPYQFMSIADRRLIDGSIQSLGRKYAEKIITHMPILMIIPGVPKFLGNKSTKIKKGFLANMFNGIFDKLGINEMEEELSGTTKYYSLDPSWSAYFDYVNPMCRTAARLLELQDYEFDGSPLDTYDWGKNTNDRIHKLFSHYNEAIPFYIHSDPQVQESFSNGTTQSSFANKVNSYSDISHEINFLLGNTGGKLGATINQKLFSFEDLEKNQQELQDFIDGLISESSGLNGFVKSITNSAQVLAAGAKLIFPEIWSDSSFSRSYSIHLKLVSPDCDTLSWYFNIWVPLAHLLALVCPRGVQTTNAYGSPFIVRAVYKGFFNVDMGIVTDMSITRGSEGGWTRDNLPTVVEVDLTIKDLYSAMTVSAYGGFKDNLLTNMSQLDYIATLCGIDINEPEIERQWDMWLTHNIKNRVKDFWTNVPERITHTLNNKATDFFGGLFMG